MGRLTERDEFGNADIIGVDSSDLQLNLEFYELYRVTEALNRLAAYEDTGRKPNEIAALDYDVAMLKQSARHANQLTVENNQLRAELEQVKIEKDWWLKDFNRLNVVNREQVSALNLMIEQVKAERDAAVECLTNHVRWNECCEFCKADCSVAGFEEKICQCSSFEYNSDWNRRGLEARA